MKQNERIGIFVPKKVRDDLKELAKKNGVTMVSQLIMLIYKEKSNEKN